MSGIKVECAKAWYPKGYIKPESAKASRLGRDHLPGSSQQETAAERIFMSFNHALH